MVVDELLVSRRPPTRSQARFVAGAAILLSAATLLSLPFRQVPLPALAAFIPIVDTVLLLGDGITATLLFAHAWVLRSRGLAALAIGYLYTGLIIVPHALTFPGAFSDEGLLRAGVSTTIWLYVFWHFGLPIAVLAYAAFKPRDSRQPLPYGAMRPILTFGILGVLLIVAALTILSTAGQSWLPALMIDARHWIAPRVNALAIFMTALLLVAIGAVLRPGRSLLDIWLALALWAWLMQLVQVMSTSERFILGWYWGRLSGLLSGVLVLLMLLSETSRLYARLALATSTQRRERESRLMTMNAAAASIAHEVKQPLAVIVANAHAGLMALEEEAIDRRELAAILTSIGDEGERAAHVVGSIRGMFARQATSKVALRVNDVIRDTLPLVAGELPGWQISLQLVLDDTIPPVSADRLQLQHVFLNLFVNAIEAMAPLEQDGKMLRVRSTREGADVVVSVSDTGGGIDAGAIDRIFEPFFTTKPTGTGLGLPLCRSIVEGLGGRLSVTSTPPSGATFDVRLPVAAPVAAAGPA